MHFCLRQKSPCGHVQRNSMLFIRHVRKMSHLEMVCFYRFADGKLKNLTFLNSFFGHNEKFLYTKVWRRCLDGSQNLEGLQMEKQTPPPPHILKKGGWGTMKMLKRGSFGDEWGRGGAVWAHTLGKRSHGLQEGFWRPPGPLGGYKRKTIIYIYIYISKMFEK